MLAAFVQRLSSTRRLTALFREHWAVKWLATREPNCVVETVTCGSRVFLDV